MSLASSLSCEAVPGSLEWPLGLTAYLISCPLASQGQAGGSPRGLTG